MSASDYISLKKRRSSDNFVPRRTSGLLTTNKQYYEIQTTPLVDEDGDFVQTSRFNIKIAYYCDLAIESADIPQSTSFHPMFVQNRIHIPEYIKNRWQNDFCWACEEQISDQEVRMLAEEIGCKVCETMHTLSESVFDLPEKMYRGEVDYFLDSPQETFYISNPFSSM